MAYMKRPLSRAIAESGQKVVIVEGARAVGKTMMAQNELVPLGFTYHSLANQTTYQLAKENPTFWVNSIEQPAIIDEAQRIKELPLAIKENVDKQTTFGTSFVLTGSASIGKASLDGQDPLTRRSQRFTLNPLTQREIRNNEANLIEDLWDGTPDPNYQSYFSEKELLSQMRTGGFPYYVVGRSSTTAIQVSEQLRSDLRSVLGDTLLPGEYLDNAIAWSILKRLLTLPGDILNMSNIGKALNCDNRTVERYVSIFANRFLIRYLPNLRQLPHKQSFTRAKIHPIDTAFSMEMIRESGKDPATDRSLFGKLLESYVVSQVIPDTQWGKRRAESFYWREPGRNPKEVDLVLLHNNELVGIEIKASTNVSRDDLKGLRALGNDQRFKRGYIVYLGEKTIPLSEKIWALPLVALWDAAAFRKSASQAKEKKVNTTKKASDKDDGDESIPALVDANVFLSYNHDDNDYLDNAMVELVKAIGDAYEFFSANKLQIFIDKHDLRWGDDWQSEIDRNIEETHFLIPCITPRYLRSEACRKELLQFLGRMRSNEKCRILSLIWQDVSNFDGRAIEMIQGHQYEDVSQLVDVSPEGIEYKQVARELAKKIHEIVIANAASTSNKTDSSPENSSPESSSPESSDTEQPDGMAFDEQFDKLMQEMPILEKSIENLQDDFREISNAIEDTPFPKTSNGSYTQWGATLAGKTQVPLKKMNENLDAIEGIWADCYSTMASLVRICRLAGQSADSILPSLYSLKNSFSSDFDSTSAMSTVKTLPLFSSRLKPLAKGLRRLLDTFNDIEKMTNDLISETESLSR